VQASGPDERFENQIHEAKMSQIWWKVVADQRVAPVVSLWKAALDTLSMMGLNDFFEYRRDEKPEGQSKVIHHQAVACKFSMKVFASSPFTGLFAPGTTTGLMRMGPPAPDMKRAGLSLKWFRSYVESANTVMAAFEGSENFFEHDFSNHIQLFDSQALLLLRRLVRQTLCSASTGLSELAKYDQDGNPAGDNVNFPFEFQLQPVNRSLAAMLGRGWQNYTTELFNQLGAIPVGTKLFNVRVMPYPGAALETIGEFSLASQCAPSMYGDDRLAFQHRRIEDDLALKPEWTDMVKEVCDQY